MKQVHPLPQGWTTASVDQVVEAIDYGYTASAAQGDGPRFLRITDIQDGRVDWATVPSCSIPESEIERYRLRPGDLVFARTGATTGKSYLIRGCPRDAVFASYLIRLRPGEAVEPGYLAYFFQTASYWGQISEQATGTAQPGVNSKRLRTVQLPVAPLHQQPAIVAAIESHFSRLDAATATLERVQRNLERYRASVLKAAVEGRLVPTEAELAKKEGRSYEPASTLLKRILAERRRRWEEAEIAKFRAKGKPPTDDRWKKRYEEPASPNTDGLPELPEGWCWASIAQVASISGGITKNANREKLPMKRPYLRVANVYANELRLNEIKHIGASEDEAERTSLLPGDLLIVEGNGSVDQIGRVAMWDGSIPGCVHQNHIIKVRLSDQALAKWSLTWLLSASGRKHIEGAASSTSGLHTLSLSKVAGLPIPLAPSPSLPSSWLRCA